MKGWTKWLVVLDGQARAKAPMLLRVVLALSVALLAQQGLIPQEVVEAARKLCVW